MDLSKMSKKERMQLFHRQSPEFKGIVADFEAKMAEASERLQPVLDAIQDGLLPADSSAANYVKIKHQLILK